MLKDQSLASTPTAAAKELVTGSELAERLGVSLPTLQRWRYEGSGPPFVKVGRKVRYAAADIDAWLAGQRKTSTSAPRGAA